MLLTLNLPSEIEIQLQAAADRTGQDVKTFATAALTLAAASVLDESIGAAVAFTRPEGTMPSSTEIERALDELEAVGTGIPARSDNLTYSRAEIYCDHD